MNLWLHCEFSLCSLLQVPGQEGVETRDFIRWLLCPCIIISQASWRSWNTHLAGVQVFVGKGTQHWFWHVHISFWFIPWMQRATHSHILCQLPWSLAWKEKISLLWFHEEKFCCTSGDVWHSYQSAFGKIMRVCAGIWSQGRLQNFQLSRRGGGTWQTHSTRLVGSLNGLCCVKFAHKSNRQVWPIFFFCLSNSRNSSLVPDGSSRSCSSDLWHGICQTNQIQAQADFAWIKHSS